MRKPAQIALIVGSGFFAVQAVLSELNRTAPVAQTAPMQTRIAQSDMPIAQPQNSSVKILRVPSMIVGGDTPPIASRMAANQGEGNMAVLTESRVMPPSIAPRASEPKPSYMQRQAPHTVARAPQRYYARPLIARMAPTRVYRTHQRLIVVPREQLVYAEQPHGIRGFFINLGHKIHQKWIALSE